MSNGVFAGGFGVLCVVLVVALVAGFIVLAVFAVRRERQRTDALVAWARVNEWSYLRRPASNWPARLPGHNRRGVTLALTGVVNGHTVSVGEYQHTEHHTTGSGAGSTSSSSTYHFVVIGLRLPRAYPPIAVAQRGLFSKLGRSLFGESKTATGNPDFDERFRVATKDPASVPFVVGPALIAAHLAGRVPPWSIVGDELLTFFSGTIKDPADIPGWAAWAIQVADLIGR